jgi:hypothetical protein
MIEEILKLHFRVKAISFCLHTKKLNGFMTLKRKIEKLLTLTFTCQQHNYTEIKILFRFLQAIQIYLRIEIP